MKISKSFNKLFAKTTEYYKIISNESITESVKGLIEFKDKYGLFVPGTDMIGSYIKFDYYHDNVAKTTYIYRVRGLYKPTEVTSRFFINVDIFSKSSYNKEWHFQSDCIQDIDWLLNKDIKLFPKEKYDKMFIKEIGKDYLVSLSKQLYGKDKIIQNVPKGLMKILEESKDLEPEFQEVIEENFNDLIAT